MDTPPPLSATPILSPTEAQIRSWSMLAHLSALAGYVVPFGSILGPILVWQLKKHEFPTVVAHAREALNFQLSCIVYLLVSALLIFVVIGLPLLVLVGLFNLICVIIAGIKANDGIAWRYPLTIRFLS